MGRRRRDLVEGGRGDRAVRPGGSGSNSGGRSRWSLLALLAVLMLLLAACGADSDSDESSDAGSEESGEGAEEAEFDRDASGGVDDGDFDVATETEAGDEAEEEAMEDEAVMSDEESAEAAGDALRPAAAEPESEPDSDQGSDGQGSDGQESDGLGAGGTRVTPTAADLGRKLIFTAFVTVEVDDVAGASAEATSIIEGMGGFLFGQNTSGGAEPRSELTFKILPADFNTALERLGSVGELRNQQVSTDDVTERIVDLESRIEVADLGVARLRAALEGSETLEDYAEIERLLLSRESDLEVMRGQLRTLQDRVDLATITLILTQDRVENQMELRISGYQEFDGGQSCPGQQLGSVETDTEVTICFEVLNVGDQTLTDVTLTDPGLDIDGDSELLTVFGSLAEVPPGQSVLVATEVKAERTLRLRTRVVAIPTDGISSEPAGPSVSTRAEYELRTFEPDSDPGFSDGFDAAVSILKGIWIGLRLTIGFLIPLLILLPFLWLAYRGVRMINDRRPKGPAAPTYGGGPASPPPPPPGPGAGGGTPSDSEPGDPVGAGTD